MYRRKKSKGLKKEKRKEEILKRYMHDDYISSERKCEEQHVMHIRTSSDNGRQEISIARTIPRLVLCDETDLFV